MKARHALFAAGFAVCAAAASLPAAPDPAEPQPTSLEEKLEAVNAGVSPYAAEVVKLAKSGIDPQVVQAFVENSANATPLRPSEIIYLHEHGVPAATITAMIKRTAKMQEQTPPAPAPAPIQVQYSVPAAAPVAAPTVITYPTVAPASVTPVVIYREPSYVYSYPSYSYASYPAYSYSSWPCCYGGYPRSFVSVGFGFGFGGRGGFHHHR